MWCAWRRSNTGPPCGAPGRAWAVLRDGCLGAMLGRPSGLRHALAMAADPDVGRAYRRATGVSPTVDARCRLARRTVRADTPIAAAMTSARPPSVRAAAILKLTAKSHGASSVNAVRRLFSIAHQLNFRAGSPAFVSPPKRGLFRALAFRLPSVSFADSRADFGRRPGERHPLRGGRHRVAGGGFPTVRHNAFMV